ncbi:MAG: bifunctional diaminohydroxyphosphoribosylaminopyrimidine deaminase/5-amino-6-(5-phosphoribosylamino)uracil reductase RibD [Acidimicrobiia bacterium]
MRRALELAGSHRPHPNPRVGAVVVAVDGRTLGEGAHQAPGMPHAEVEALRQAGQLARGATLYVTLEPCTHQGRTPPCVGAILESGVARVVVGAGDPDPRVSGSGIAALREAGLEVVQGMMAAGAEAVDPAYFRHRRTGLPMVTLKYAMTLDGSIAAADGSSRWVSSETAREDAHRLRAGVDGVVVGAGTVRADDPQLSVRLPGYEGPQPRAVIVAGSVALPDNAAIWKREPLVVSASPMDVPAGEVIQVDGSDGVPEPLAAARAIAEEGYLDLLLEGGSRLAGAWWRAGVITGGVVYLAAKMGGGRGISPLAGGFSSIEEAREVTITGVRSLDGDYRVDFERV